MRGVRYKNSTFLQFVTGLFRGRVSYLFVVIEVSASLLVVDTTIRHQRSYGVISGQLREWPKTG
jgi:hypothetical protein